MNYLSLVSLSIPHLLALFYLQRQFLCMIILIILYFCFVQPFRFHWCPFGRLAQLPSLFEYVLLQMIIFYYCLAFCSNILNTQFYLIDYFWPGGLTYKPHYLHM
jgi:hypothetical protein